MNAFCPILTWRTQMTPPSTNQIIRNQSHAGILLHASYKTKIFYDFVRLFNNRPQKTSKHGMNVIDTPGCLGALLFRSCHTLTSSVIYSWTDPLQHGKFSNCPHLYHAWVEGTRDEQGLLPAKFILLTNSINSNRLNISFRWFHHSTLARLMIKHDDKDNLMFSFFS